MKHPDLKTKIFTAIIFLFCSVKTLGQNYTYYLNSDLVSVPKDKATLLGKSYKQNSSWILDCYLIATGKKIITAQVKDSLLSELHGPFKSYHDNTRIESEGAYYNNEMDGVWTHWNEDGLMTDSAVYVKGVRTAFTNYHYNYPKPGRGELFSNEKIKNSLSGYSYSFTDSLKDTFIEESFSIRNGKKRLDYEVNFLGQKGLLKKYDSTSNEVKADSVFTRKKEEAGYPGGEDAWRNYLRRNLNALTPADNGSPSGKFTVVIKFIVNKDGYLEDIKAENNPGFGMAAEGIRIIKNSGRWNPAFFYGAYVPAYRRQPITFLVEN
jgi:antitoxin component YwqK of YwqJK toxin-antitoxin module